MILAPGQWSSSRAVITNWDLLHFVQELKSIWMWTAEHRVCVPESKKVIATSAPLPTLHISSDAVDQGCALLMEFGSHGAK